MFLQKYIQLCSGEPRKADRIFANRQSGNTALAPIDPHHVLGGGIVLLDVDFVELEAALFQDGFGSAAIGTPSGGIYLDHVFIVKNLRACGVRKDTLDKQTLCRYTFFRLRASEVDRKSNAG